MKIVQSYPNTPHWKQKIDKIANRLQFYSKIFKTTTMFPSAIFWYPVDLPMYSNSTPMPYYKPFTIGLYSCKAIGITFQWKIYSETLAKRKITTTTIVYLCETFDIYRFSKGVEILFKYINDFECSIW